MSIRRPNKGVRSREELRALLLDATYHVADTANDRLVLERLVQVRTGLLAGREDLLRVVDPTSVVYLLGDRDSVLCYAELLAAEAAARRAGGDDIGARSLEGRALSIALAMPSSDPVDSDVAEFVEALRLRIRPLEPTRVANA